MQRLSNIKSTPEVLISKITGNYKINYEAKGQVKYEGINYWKQTVGIFRLNPQFYQNVFSKLFLIFSVFKLVVK